MKRPHIPPVSFFFQPQSLCTISLYLVFELCIASNFYVLFCRSDTIFYMRGYHVIVGVLMITCMLVMLEFLARSRGLAKLDEPHEIPTPAVIGLVGLTLGVVIGFFYLIVFNYAFSSCDKLVDAIYGSELYLDAIYNVLMICFCLLSVIYILQRRYYGTINSSLDRITRLYINVTFCVVWIKVVIYKGYLSQQELCQRKELEKYWCPVMQRDYLCNPGSEFQGTQKIWYYLHKGLLNTAVMSCASEVFPVLIIAHWLACGNAKESAEVALKRQQRGIRSLLQHISTVYTNEVAHNLPPLQPRRILKVAFNIIVFVATVGMIVRWLVFFYYSMDYNTLYEQKWLTNDIVELIACFLQLILFTVVYLWARSIPNVRLDIHHRESARGDVIILFGCCLFLTVKFGLMVVETEFQNLDGFANQQETVIRIFVLVFIHINEWIQYLSVRRLLALSDADVKTSRHFLPFIALCGVVLAWIHFGLTFLDSSIIHFQLTEEEFHYSETTLLCMIFTQTIIPADYLYGFTISGCWLEILIRYLDIGFFQLGRPRLETAHSGSHVHLLDNHEPHRPIGGGGILGGAFKLHQQHQRDNDLRGGDDSTPTTTEDDKSTSLASDETSS